MARTTPPGLIYLPGIPTKPYPGQRWWIQMVRRTDEEIEPVYRGPFRNETQAEGALSRILLGKWMTYTSGWVLTKRNPTEYNWAAPLKWLVVARILLENQTGELRPVIAD